MNLYLTVVTCLTAAAAVGASIPLSFASEFNPFLPRQPVNKDIVATEVVENYVTQRVDNFDTNNFDTYQQRYLAYTEHHQSGGPFLILLGGFQPVSAERMMSSLPYGLARDLHGSVFYLEHRYYGNSFPVSNLTNANLRFLNVEQALADIAHFVDFLQEEHATDEHPEHAIIVIGAHYSGNLAVWFRQKYPRLADGAVASAAPVLSVVNHQLYKETAAASYRSFGGDVCYDALETGFNAIEDMVQRGELDELSEMFHLCRDSYLRTDRGINLFFASVSEVFAFIVQTATPASIRGVCQLLQNPAAQSPVHAVLDVLNFLGNIFGPDDDFCLPLDYDFVIEEERKTELDSIAAIYGIRQRTYQACTQLGWLHTSDSPNQPFGNRFPLEFVHLACEDVFDEVFDPVSAQANSDRLNTNYGALTPNVQQAIFTHGELDPWRTIGITQSRLNAPALVISGSPQGAELLDFNDSDSDILRAAKNTIAAYVAYWVVIHESET